MWQKIRFPLLFLSLGMNLAFLIVLGLFYVPKFLDGYDRHRDHWDKRKHARKAKDKDPGWYFYKHKLGVSDTQWTNLRPDMEAFHGKALEICKEIRKLRNKILRLIEEPETNENEIETAKNRIMELRRNKQRLFVDYMTDKKQYLDRDQERTFFGMLRKDRDCDKHARFLEHRGDSSHEKKHRH